jgi:hypothetical protein
VKLTVRQLQALMNALDVAFEDDGLDLSDYPILQMLVRDVPSFRSLRGALVRERIAIDPDFAKTVSAHDPTPTDDQC